MALALVASAVIGRAQEGKMTNPNGLAIDTFANTTAEGPWARVPGEVKVATFTMEITAGTGTVAGKVYLRRASRGPSTSPKWGDNRLDSLTLNTGSGNYSFEVKDPGGQYYQLYVVPTGTQSTYYVAYYYIRKP